MLATREFEFAQRCIGAIFCLAFSSQELDSEHAGVA